MAPLLLSFYSHSLIVYFHNTFPKTFWKTGLILFYADNTAILSRIFAGLKIILRAGKQYCKENQRLEIGLMKEEVRVWISILYWF